MAQNYMPPDEFQGLSPVDMHNLLYDTFGGKSPLSFSDTINDDILDQIPLFRIAEEYLKIIQRDKQIKLTPLGALPKKVMAELYDKRFLPDEYIESGITKLWKEGDCISIMSARFSAELAGLVKKANNRLTLTKTAARYLDTNNRLQIFKQFFQAFTGKFSWSYNDGYPEQPIGQLGWAYSVIMLRKYGNQPRTAHFYAEKYLQAFPAFLTFFPPEESTPVEQYFGCYTIRTFERFLLWFGFVTANKQHTFSDLHTDTFKQTELLKHIFDVNR